MATAMLKNLEVIAGDQVKVTQGDEFIWLEVAHDEKLPDNCVRIAGAHPKTVALGALFGEILVEKL